MSKPKSLQPTITPILVSFDLEADDALIRGHGVRFRHFRAVRCPVGMSDIYDNRAPHPDHAGCSNGFLYQDIGLVTAHFSGNSEDTRKIDVGLIDGSSVQASFPRFYDETEDPVMIVPFDRFYLEEPGITVVNWQLFHHNLSGVDKFRYPLESVEHLVDSSGTVYQEGIDFAIKDGIIHWGSKRPKFDPDTQKGCVCSIRYRYRPYYYCSRLIHEIRVAQRENPVTGERYINRVGQNVILTREYIFEKNQNDSDTPIDDLRANRLPVDITFGNR